MNDERSWADRLERLGTAVQRRVIATSHRSDIDPALPVADEGGDTVFAIDRDVEPVIVGEIDGWPEGCKPLLLIAEGFGSDGRRVFGADAAALERCRYRVIVDPIDGSRGLMYDKRSAWFLAAVAPDRGETTALREAFAAAMVELPTSKQCWCDSYVATSGRPAIGKRSRIGTERGRSFVPRPSAATNLTHGFAQVSNFFPGTKVLASDLMERIAVGTVGTIEPGRALIFDDQYISSGGQIVELMNGHDRFCCDLRPLFYRIQAKRSGSLDRGLECHPYDVAGTLVATQAGIVITDAFGNRLDCQLNVTSAVHWCGYANEAVAAQVGPIIRVWLSEHGILDD